jgi:hypothetical protein
MIVNLTRGDMRDEFAMADEAFALSPISARATQPREEDYDAIREAFMETSRGRWFLGEYARRNRNADTRMVLDAVERIEEALTVQNTQASDRAHAEAFAAIRDAVEAGRAAAIAAAGDLAVQENLAPVRKGARVIREIAWRLREIGADGRICDLIDSQVGAIEGACGKMNSIDPATALSAAFDLVEQRLAAFGESDAEVASAAAQAVVSPRPDAERAVAASAPAAEAASACLANQAAAGMPDAVHTMAAASDAEAVEMTETTAGAPNMAAEAFDAHDDAVLDMVAFEMAAPDPTDYGDPFSQETEIVETAIAESAPSKTEVAKPEITETEIAKAPPSARLAAAEKHAPAAAQAIQPAPLPQPSPRPSLGSSLIANGIVRRPTASRTDPLAPIRRMSQAEKIAFFS